MRDDGVSRLLLRYFFTVSRRDQIWKWGSSAPFCTSRSPDFSAIGSRSEVHIDVKNSQSPFEVKSQ